MKKFVNTKTLPLLVMACSLLAMFLRIWTRGGGADEAGLFPAKPFVWVLLLLLTGATVALIVNTVKRLKDNGTYQDYYPQSIPAGLCAVPAAVIFIVSGYQQLRNVVAKTIPGMTVVDTVTAFFAMAAGLCLLLYAAHRCIGKKPCFAYNGLVCLYFAVRLFNRCQIWSNEPQIGIVLFPFFASTALMLSAYQRVCFDVDLGKRRRAALWSLMSVFLCMVAMVSLEQPLYYGLCALWQLADLCSLRPLKRKVKAEPQPEQSTQEMNLPEADA